MATAAEQVKKQTNQKPELKFDHPFVKLCVFKAGIVIQQKGGNIIKGRAKWFRKGILKLTDAEIIGANQTVKTPWLLVDHQSIAHVHPDPAAEPMPGEPNGKTEGQ